MDSASHSSGTGETSEVDVVSVNSNEELSKIYKNYQQFLSVIPSCANDRVKHIDSAINDFQFILVGNIV